MLDLAVLAGAAFFAGMLNTIAGGGTFLTFPALVFTGVPIVAANATSAVAVFPGYLGGALGFRREISTVPSRQLVRVMVVTAIGGLIGSCLLLISSNEIFSKVVPFLLSFATLVFAFANRIQEWMKRGSGNGFPGSIGVLLVSIYGGYFNGGLGIMLLALFSLGGMRDLNLMNGLKNWLSFVLSALSVATFSLAGIVAWQQALLMAVAATVGGYAGAPVARTLPRSVVRAIVIIVGCSLSIVFFYRAFS